MFTAFHDTLLLLFFFSRTINTDDTYFHIMDFRWFYSYQESNKHCFLSCVKRADGIAKPAQ